MYIQKINIKNFKSFKDETIIPFCEGLNIINGANGSGKSNFINSIRFVLCDLENSKNIIRTNEKECSVEIIFNGEEEKIILEKRITQNEDNSFTESFFHNRQQVSKQIYETVIKNLSGISIDKKFDETDFKTKVKNSKIYISDNIFAFLDYKKTNEIGNFLKENSKEKQLIIVSHNNGIIKHADSLIELPQKNNKKLSKMIKNICLYCCFRTDFFYNFMQHKN